MSKVESAWFFMCTEGYLLVCSPFSPLHLALVILYKLRSIIALSMLSYIRFCKSVCALCLVSFIPGRIFNTCSSGCRKKHLAEREVSGTRLRKVIHSSRLCVFQVLVTLRFSLILGIIFIPSQRYCDHTPPGAV